MLYSKSSSAPGTRHYHAQWRREAGTALGHTAAGGQQRTDLEPRRLQQGVQAHGIMRELINSNQQSMLEVTNKTLEKANSLN